MKLKRIIQLLSRPVKDTATISQWKKVNIFKVDCSNTYSFQIGTAFEIEYQVLDGGDLDLDFMLFAPSGRLIVDEKRSEEGLHEVASAEEGDYQVITTIITTDTYIIFKICFDNIFSRMTAKTVFWEVFVEDDYDYGDYDDGDYEDYYDDDEKPIKDALTGEEKKKGAWKENLGLIKPIL